jgi:hypothetical protein
MANEVWLKHWKKVQQSKPGPLKKPESEKTCKQNLATMHKSLLVL